MPNTALVGFAATLLMIGSLACAFQSESMGQTVKTQAPSPSDKNAREIEKLIEQLSDNGSVLRDKAGKRLKEIGVSALPALCKAQASENRQVSQRSQQLTEEIELAHGLIKITAPVLCNEAEFCLLVTPIWHIPPPGQEQPIRLALKITNRGTDQVRFYLMDTMWVDLRDAKGRLLLVAGGRDITGRGRRFSPPLSPGDSYTASHFNARLSWYPDGLVPRLRGEDGFLGIWYMPCCPPASALAALPPYHPAHDPVHQRGLVPGTYDLSVRYENKTQAMDGGPRFWVGAVATNPCTVLVN